MQPDALATSRVAVSNEIVLRSPCAEDGRAVHDLIAQCPPLDRNSLYCNLLQCCHFADTCVLAQHANERGELAGFVSAYLPPDRNDTVFVWQVAVAPTARGIGLAHRMLIELLTRPRCAGVNLLETTITPDNQASWALFESLARSLAASWSSVPLFERDRHFGGRHETEMLVTIGPFAARMPHRN